MPSGPFAGHRLLRIRRRCVRLIPQTDRVRQTRLIFRTCLIRQVSLTSLTWVIWQDQAAEGVPPPKMVFMYVVEGTLAARQEVDTAMRCAGYSWIETAGERSAFLADGRWDSFQSSAPPTPEIAVPLSCHR